MSVDGLFRRDTNYYGQFAGDFFNPLRPNYNQVDNTPKTVPNVNPPIRYRLDPSSPQFAEPKFKEIDWYEIFGNRNILLPGDILQKSTADGGMTPTVTVAHYMNNKALVGFRTSRVGMLTNQINSPIYTTVYFSFLGAGFPGSSINSRLEESLKLPHAKVVIFKRQNLFRLRTQLIETDLTQSITKDGIATTFQRKWLIEEIDTEGNIQILHLSHNDQ